MHLKIAFWPPDGRLAHYRIRVNLAMVGNTWLVSTLEFVG
jgi:hypothetical protein